VFSLLTKFAPLGWNEHAFTAADFARLCRKEKIKVFDLPLVVPGFFLVCKGQRAIYLNSKSRGLWRLYSGLHELAHHYLHAPVETTSAFFFGLKPNTREEIEAEAFAVVALLPEPKLRLLLGIPQSEWECGITEEMIALRLKILDTYGV